MAEEKWLYENIVAPKIDIVDMINGLYDLGKVSKKLFNNKPVENKHERISGLNNLNIKIKTIYYVLNHTQECINYPRIVDKYGMLKFIAETNDVNVGKMFKMFHDEDLILSECNMFVKAIKILVKRNRQHTDAYFILHYMNLTNISTSEKLAKLKRMYEKLNSRLINDTISTDTDQGIFDRIFMNLFMDECYEKLKENCPSDEDKLNAYMKGCEYLTSLVLQSPPILGLTESEIKFYSDYIL